jgi:hypothetical protein
LAANSGLFSKIGGAPAGMLSAVAQYKQAKRTRKELRIRGRIAAEEVRRETAQLIGAQRARFAKAGVAVEGTPTDVIASTRETEELRALRTQFSFEAEGRAIKQQAKSALISQAINATMIMGLGTLQLSHARGSGAPQQQRFAVNPLGFINPSAGMQPSRAGQWRGGGWDTSAASGIA